MADASAAMAALLRDGPARAALAVDDVHAPHLIDFEVASGIRRQFLAGALTASDGLGVLTQWRRFALRRHSAHGLIERTWELRSGFTPYDAAYAVLAEALGCPLVTADRRFARGPGLPCEVVVVPR